MPGLHRTTRPRSSGWRLPALRAHRLQPASRRERARDTTVAQSSADWRSLSAAEQRALAPLQRDWAQLDEAQKEKWIEIAQRLPSMSPEQRQRIQDRMADWARMTPAERGQARLRFLQAQRTRRRAAATAGVTTRRCRTTRSRVSPRVRPLPSASAASRSRPPASARRSDPDAPAVKSNLVTNPNFSAQPRPIAPTTIKAGPGCLDDAGVEAADAAAAPADRHAEDRCSRRASSTERPCCRSAAPQGAAAVPVGEQRARQPVPRP